MSDDSSDSGTSRSWLERVGQLFTSTPGSRDELLALIRSMRDSDVIDGDTLGIIEGAICVSDMQVREILIPRSQMVSIRAATHPRDFLPTIIESAHSRFPVLGEDRDEIIGILLAKDLLALILEPSRMKRFAIKDHVRSAMVVPESKQLDSLLREFRITKNHMAIVVNEYGGVAGLVTIEDVLEQIVGEIEDEHDIEEDDYLIKDLEGEDFTVKAITPIDEFNQHFETHYSDDEFDTIGGLVMHAFGRLPQREETVDMDHLRFTVLSADGRTIRLLRVTPLGNNRDDNAQDN